MDFLAYDNEGFYDEMFGPDGHPWPRGELLAKRLATLPTADVVRRQRAADLALLEHGHHVQRLRPRGRHREDLAVRHRPADHRSAANGTRSSAG